MITAELHEPLLEDSMTDVPYNPVPQTPSAAEFDFAVSINFPEMLMVTPTATPESTSTTDDPPTYTDTPTAGGGFLPAKLQPPAFSVHRCHHRGMDRRGEEDAFELPFGFPEVIQHLHTIPSHVSSRHANDIVLTDLSVITRASIFKTKAMNPCPATKEVLKLLSVT
jgi:hypothetical protein